MKKIISLFKRNYTGNRLVYNEVVPGAEWVLNGEGIATRKYDGTCCLVKDGILYKRYDAKHGKTPPINFIAAQDPDPLTGHWPGWVIVQAEDTSNKYFIEAYKKYGPLADGTYELIGPKINGNPEHRTEHMFTLHGETVLESIPRDYEGLKQFLKEARIVSNMEGIVFYHPDGRMVKIKAKDFGF